MKRFLNTEMDASAETSVEGYGIISLSIMGQNITEATIFEVVLSLNNCSYLMTLKQWEMENDLHT